MKTIKVAFVDLPSEMDPQNNYIVDLLKKRYHLEFSDDPDFVFYAAFNYKYQEYADKVRIFIGGEPIVPNFNDCDYAMSHMPIQFSDRYFEAGPLLASPRGEGLKPSIQDRSDVTDDMFHRKFCNFVYSNSQDHDGWAVRQAFCQKLMAEYKHVDCPGKSLNNMPEGAIAPRWVSDANGNQTVPDEVGWVNGKIRFLQDYKFTIAFENGMIAGYTTEKLVDPFLARSIPIYWGNPEVVKYYNPKAFINCNDYDNDFDRVVARVKELDNDEKQYMAMLREPPLQPDFPFDMPERFLDWMSHIIEKGPHPLCKNPAGFIAVSCPRQFEMIFNEYCSRGERLKLYEGSNLWRITMAIKKFGDSRWGVLPKKAYHFYLRHKRT